MKPKVTINNEISADSSLIGFPQNIELYYKIANTIKHEGVLIGSTTALNGIKEFMTEIPKEKSEDFFKPKKDENLPFWIIVDSTGKLENYLHVYRNFEFCKDVIVLVSENTPKDYIEYLEKRKYNYIVSGEYSVDLKKSLDILNEEFKIENIRTDSGSTLNSVLLEQGLVDEISLLISPHIIGKNIKSVFKDLEKPLKLNLIKSEKFNNHIWVLYKIEDSY